MVKKRNMKGGVGWCETEQRKVRKIHLKERMVGYVWLCLVERTEDVKAFSWGSLAHYKNSKDNIVVRVDSEGKSGRG